MLHPRDIEKKRPGELKIQKFTGRVPVIDLLDPPRTSLCPCSFSVLTVFPADCEPLKVFIRNIYNRKMPDEN